MGYREIWMGYFSQLVRGMSSLSARPLTRTTATARSVRRFFETMGRRGLAAVLAVLLEHGFEFLNSLPKLKNMVYKSLWIGL